LLLLQRRSNSSRATHAPIGDNHERREDFKAPFMVIQNSGSKDPEDRMVIIVIIIDGIGIGLDYSSTSTERHVQQLASPRAYREFPRKSQQ